MERYDELFLISVPLPQNVSQEEILERRKLIMASQSDVRSALLNKISKKLETSNSIEELDMLVRMFVSLCGVR